jgi:hypothetical protein
VEGTESVQVDRRGGGMLKIEDLFKRTLIVKERAKNLKFNQKCGAYSFKSRGNRQGSNNKS